MTPTPVASTSSTSPAATTSTATATSSHKSGLGTGPIVGIAIGAVAFAVLAGVVVYMCGRQKTIKEVLRHSHRPPPGTDSYQPASPGFSEANYPNMQKTGVSSFMSGRFSSQTPYGPGPGTETESYRSASPPVDERSAMMHAQHGVMNPGSFGPGFPPNSPGLSTGSTQISGPSPGYYDTPEADGTIRYAFSSCDSHIISFKRNLICEVQTDHTPHHHHTPTQKRTPPDPTSSLSHRGILAVLHQHR